MDWREFFKGFIGTYKSQWPTRPDSRREDQDERSPPPNIRDFYENRGDSGSSSNGCGRGGCNGDDNNVTGHWPDEEGELFNFSGRGFGGNSFVFGDIFSIMGEMFQEMDRNMRNLDGFFESHHNSMFPPIQGHQEADCECESRPPAPSQIPTVKKGSGSVRDLVLKDSEPHQNKHYLAEPKGAAEKVDRDLDDLHSKSMLDMSDLPVPSVENNQHSKSRPNGGSGILPFGFNGFGIFGDGQGSSGDHHNHNGGGGASSTFSKTYQTFSFKNGKWEGESVTEDGNGKSITRYFTDSDGVQREETQFFPRNSTNSHPPTEFGGRLDDGGAVTGPLVPHRGDDVSGSSIFQMFDRFFKPRM